MDKTERRSGSTPAMRRACDRAADAFQEPLIVMGVTPSAEGGAYLEVGFRNGPTSEMIEAAVRNLLAYLAADAAETAPTCPCCAERLARLTAAVAALDAGAGAEPRPERLH